MNNSSNPEPNNEGEWDEKENLLWNETEWRNYLDSLDKETERFLKFYAELAGIPERLDETAHLMGWESEDGFWNDIDISDESFALERKEDIENSNDAECYTLHGHPLFIVTRSLYRDLRRIWETLMQQSGGTLSPSLVWELADSFNNGETDAILAVQAVDLEDYALALCHLKNALASLNTSLSIVSSAASCNPPLASAFQKELHQRLFDLRELWLRAMHDCREQVQLQADDELEE